MENKDFKNISGNILNNAKAFEEQMSTIVDGLKDHLTEEKMNLVKESFKKEVDNLKSLTDKLKQRLNG